MAHAQYTDLKLGYASAEEESTEEPQLLLGGFLNFANSVKEALEGSLFLFLGYKGSGKSAINEHLRLVSENEPGLFVTSTFLADFPYSDFRKIIVGESEPEAKYPTAWSWLLLLKLIESFSKDEGAESSRSSEFLIALKGLDELGLIPLPSLKQVVLTSSKNSFRVNLATVLQNTYETSYEDRSLQLPFFVERLKKIATSFRSESRHLLIIDGLDDILSKREAQYQSLAALIFEVGALNRAFRRERAPVKILLLCRTDLFERLPNANKNKLRQDSAFSLDWYHNTRDPKESNLVKLVNLRARLQDSGLRDVFVEYFPRECDGRPIREFLLELTRHTPRDFIQLLKHIQRFSKGGRLTRDEILSGVRSYSLDYFFPEIKDELVGYVPAGDIDPAFEVIGSLRQRDFGYAELTAKAKANSRAKDVDFDSLFATLFECSAVGNIHNRPHGTTYYTFRHRNRNATLSFEDRFLLHRGLWKSLNLV
jgi:hypothetical protein